LKHEEGARDRIDLGARLGPAITACIGVPTRGVRGSRLMHKVPGRPESAPMTAPRTWHKPIVGSGPRTASSPAADSGAVSLLTAPSFPWRGIEPERSGSVRARLSSRGSSSPWRFGSSSVPTHERGQLPKDDG
jgi:hypothetical protein